MITQEEQVKKFLAWWEHKFLQWFLEEGSKQFTDWMDKNKKRIITTQEDTPKEPE